MVGSAGVVGLGGDSAINQTRKDDYRITVYRVVDPTELTYLRATGNYGSNPSQSGKYFALSLTGAQAFAVAPMNIGSTITRTTVPEAIVNQGFWFLDPGATGAGASVFFAQPQLPKVYVTMTPPVIIPNSRP